MEIQKVIKELKAAKAPSRKLDAIIAKALGFKLFPKTKDHPTYWLSPDGAEVIIPRYSFSLDAAYELAIEHAPNAKGGVSWDPKTAAARIGKADNFVAANAPMAICIATLNHREAQGMDSQGQSI